MDTNKENGIKSVSIYTNSLIYRFTDLKIRVEEAMETKAVQGSKREERKTYVSSTLYELIPKSCTCPFILSNKDDKGEIKGSDAIIKGPWPVEPIKKDIAGTVGRVYTCKMYKIEVKKCRP